MLYLIKDKVDVPFKKLQQPTPLTLRFWGSGTPLSPVQCVPCCFVTKSGLPLEQFRFVEFFSPQYLSATYEMISLSNFVCSCLQEV